MTHELRETIHTNDMLVASSPCVLESDAQHRLRVRMDRIRKVLLEANLYGPTLGIEPMIGHEVIDGEHRGNVEPMGTMHLDVTGFADEFTLEGLRDALRYLLADVERRIKRGEK